MKERSFLGSERFELRKKMDMLFDLVYHIFAEYCSFAENHYSNS